MSFSQHNLRFAAPLRDARVQTARETYVSEGSIRAQLDDRYRAGYDAGQKALSEELVRQRTQLLDIQNNVLRSIERTLPAFAAQCEKDLIALALQAARRVVQNTPISVEAIEAAIRAGLVEIQGAVDYEVRLNPEDFTLLQTVQSPALPHASSRVSFLADSSVSRADCVINTRHGAVEINREKMFNKLEAAALC